MGCVGTPIAARKSDMSDLKARKVVTRSGRGYRGYFPSRKLDRMVEYESLLERDAIYLFELSPGVKSFQEQPELIMYEHEGRIRKYFPDFEVVLNSGKVLNVEIKPKAKLLQPALLSKYKAIAQRYESHSASFLILTEDEIRKEPLHSNIKLMDRCKSLYVKSGYTLCEITQFISTHHLLSFSQLAEKFGYQLILNLIAEYQLVCDLEMPLMATCNYVNLAKEADHAKVLF